MASEHISPANANSEVTLSDYLTPFMEAILFIMSNYIEKAFRSTPSSNSKRELRYPNLTNLCPESAW